MQGHAISKKSASAKVFLHIQEADIPFGDNSAFRQFFILITPESFADPFRNLNAILGLERAFRTLDMRWPRWVEAVPAYTVGALGAYWTLQRTVMLLGGLR